jgi:integrase
MTLQAKEALLEQFKITGKDPDQRVFKSPVHNNPWIKNSAFRDYWEKSLTKAGVEYRNPYQMRHTFISYMLGIGNNPLVLYVMVGHSNPNIMYNKYARFIQQSGGVKLLKTS